MVTTKTIRCVSRRMLLAFLASAGVAGVHALPAAAQSGTRTPAAGSPASNFGLNGITLAPGETIVNSSTVGGGAIEHGGGNYQIIDSSSVPVAAGPAMDSMMLQPQPQAMGAYGQPGYPPLGNAQMGNAQLGNTMGGCASGNCGGGCASGNCGGSYGGSYSGVNACTGPACNPYLYASLDGLYITNTNVNNYTLSPNFRLNDFDYEFGARLTLGMVPDCRNGMEISGVAPIDWTSQNTLTQPGAGIGTFLAPRAPFVAGQLSTFSNATFQSQRYEAEYYSLEANRTLIGWEVCKLLYGLRYINYDEDYFYRSTSAAGQGLLQSSTKNKMIGAQLGLEMTYPMTCKIWTDFRGRGGLYGNFSESTFRVDNAGVTQVNNFSDDTQLAAAFEMGGGVRYYINDDFHIRAGSELWYLVGVASSTDQINPNINLNNARRTESDDDILMVGLSLGAELKF